MAGAITTTTIPLRDQLRASQEKLESLSKRTSAQLRKGKQSLLELSEKAKANAQEMAEHAVQTTEVGGAALLVGVGTGKTGGYDLGGIPIELLLSMGLHAVGYGLGLSEQKESASGEPVQSLSRGSEHVHNIADGLLAGGLTIWGLGMGRKWAQDDAAAQQASAAQQLVPPQVRTTPA